MYGIYRMLVSIPNGLPRPFSHRMKTTREFVACPVSIPNGLPRPFSPDRRATSNQQKRLFQSRPGSPGHLACGTHSIAWEAMLCNSLREALFGEGFSV